MTMNGQELLSLIKDDPTLIDRLEVGLSTVIPKPENEARRVRFQVPADPFSEEFSGRPRGRPYHDVSLSGGGGPDGGGKWYRIVNGWAGGYITDAAALKLYIRGGEQLTLEVSE